MHTTATGQWHDPPDATLILATEMAVESLLTSGDLLFNSVCIKWTFFMGQVYQQNYYTLHEDSHSSME